MKQNKIISIISLLLVLVFFNTMTTSTAYSLVKEDENSKGYTDGCLFLRPFNNASDGNHQSAEYVKGFNHGYSACTYGMSKNYLDMIKVKAIE